MRHFNIGDYMCGYQIIMEYMDEEKSLCIGNNGDNYAVFETYDDTITHAYTVLTKEEADFLFSQIYKLHNDIKGAAFKSCTFFSRLTQTPKRRC